jgi:hypothetical protein
MKNNLKINFITLNDMEKFSNKPYFSYYEEKKLKALEDQKKDERLKYKEEEHEKSIKEKEHTYNFVNEWDMHK